MAQYSPEIREAALRRILPPNPEIPAVVARDMGISAQTLLNWEKRAAADGTHDFDDVDDACQLSSDDKFEIVVATAGMNETQLGEFARSRGLFVEQIKTWRSICREANASFSAMYKRFKADLKSKDEENKALQRDLDKKNKTIAELAAEIVLRKKCWSIWGEKKEG